MSLRSFTRYYIQCDVAGCAEDSMDGINPSDAASTAREEGFVRRGEDWFCGKHRTRGARRQRQSSDPKGVE